MKSADQYASDLATQLRKGFLAYCVLRVCSHQAKYTSNIIADLQNADLVVVEGTIYPLLSASKKMACSSTSGKKVNKAPRASITASPSLAVTSSNILNMT